MVEQKKLGGYLLLLLLHSATVRNRPRIKDRHVIVSDGLIVVISILITTIDNPAANDDIAAGPVVETYYPCLAQAHLLILLGLPVPRRSHHQ